MIVIPWWKFYIKMKGGGQSPPGVGLSEIVWSWIGAFCGIAPVFTGPCSLNSP